MEVKKLFSFDGRVGRGAIWGLGTVNFLIVMVVGSIAMNANNVLVGFLAIAVIAVTSWAGLATNVKRWHDRDKSGYWYFITFIPIVGPIWALIELGFLPGTDGPNQYGLPGSGSPFVSEALPFDATAITPQGRGAGR